MIEMTIRLKRERKKRASVLLQVMILIGALAFVMPYFARKIHTSYRNSFRKIALKEAFYGANGGVAFALSYIANQDKPVPDGRESIEFTSFGDLPTLHSVSIEKTGMSNIYKVTAEGESHSVTRTIEAKIHKDPPSKVFDYIYFLNNWGWWYGASIMGWGDVRTNGRFDFRYNPTLYGEVFAAQEIDLHGGQLRGWGGEPGHQHPGVDRLEMPNLHNLDYYINLAQEKNGQLKIGGEVVIDQVYDGNIYLEGTNQDPIEVDGPVVVTGDVIIEGKLEGQGTIYSGNNVYIAGSLTYENTPDYNRYKHLQKTEAELDQMAEWVDQNIDEDLVGIAANENVFFGDVTNRTWKRYVYDGYSFSLKYQGDEHVGEDGIPGTGDDDIPYDHDGDPGTPPTTWFDLDGDGIVDDNYDYNTDIALQDLETYARYPRDHSDRPLPYGNVATNSLSHIYSVIYTNHAFAGLGSALKIYGTMVVKDECVVAYGSIQDCYDLRLHSRYNTDPNRFIDLGLPVAEKARIVSWVERGGS
jgi:hypothetical protein